MFMYLTPPMGAGCDIYYPHPLSIHPPTSSQWWDVTQGRIKLLNVRRPYAYIWTKNINCPVPVTAVTLSSVPTYHPTGWIGEGGAALQGWNLEHQSVSPPYSGCEQPEDKNTPLAASHTLIHSH